MLSDMSWRARKTVWGLQQYTKRNGKLIHRFRKCSGTITNLSTQSERNSYISGYVNKKKIWYMYYCYKLKNVSSLLYIDFKKIIKKYYTLALFLFKRIMKFCKFDNVSILMVEQVLLSLLQ